MEDTLTALSTGCLRARDGAVLKRFYGRAFLQNREWRSKMDVIVQMIRAVRSRFDNAKKTGLIKVSGDKMYVDDQGLANWFDATRQQILKIFSEVCAEAGV
jgi:hypothetical protein